MTIPLIKKNIGGVYCIRNLIDGKVYIGSSVSMRRRLCHHSQDLKNKRHSNFYLQASYDKYGDENFEFIILELVEDQTKLTLREQFYINFYRSSDRSQGFNLVCNAFRIKHSEETKKRISLKNKGRKRSKEHCEKMKTYMPRGENHCRWGVKWTDEERKQISLRQRGEKAPNYGRKFGPETRAKQSAFRKGKTHNHSFCRPILQLSLDGELLNRYESFKEVNDKFGSISGVKKACKVNCGISIGFRWMYASSKLRDHELIN